MDKRINEENFIGCSGANGQTSPASLLLFRENQVALMSYKDP
jgi:hypothetical protein